MINGMATSSLRFIGAIRYNSSIAVNGYSQYDKAVLI